jgi:hypothetical protein
MLERILKGWDVFVRTNISTAVLLLMIFGLPETTDVDSKTGLTSHNEMV